LQLKVKSTSIIGYLLKLIMLSLVKMNDKDKDKKEKDKGEVPGGSKDGDKKCKKEKKKNKKDDANDEDDVEDTDRHGGDVGGGDGGKDSVIGSDGVAVVHHTNVPALSSCPKGGMARKSHPGKGVAENYSATGKVPGRKKDVHPGK